MEYTSSAPEVLKELEAFCSQEEKALSDNLCQILVSIAKTGLTCYCWDHLKTLLRFVINKNLVESNSRVADCGTEGGSTFEERRAQVLSSLDSFVGPPFTLQRLCELLVEPQLYSSTKKYLNALEKMFAVSQTLATLTPSEFEKEATKLAANFQAVSSPPDPALTQEARGDEGNTTKVVGTSDASDMEI